MRTRWYTVQFRLDNGNSIRIVERGAGAKSAERTARARLKTDHGIQPRRIRSVITCWEKEGVMLARNAR